MSTTTLDEANFNMKAAWYGLFVLVMTMVFSLINLQLIYVLAESFKGELDLNDTQIGTLTGVAFGLTIIIATYPMGWLSDKVNRKVLLACCVFIWSISTVFSGLSQNYTQLFISIMGIALGEAVLGPITYSIIPDLFPRKKRVIANYVFFLSSILGASTGLILSGGLFATIDSIKHTVDFIPTDMETWRITMISAFLPSLVIIPAILMIKLERKHIQQDSSKSQTPDSVAESSSPEVDSKEEPKIEPSNRKQVIVFVRNNLRTMIGVFLGFGLSYSAKTALFVWTPPAFRRIYDESIAEVGLRLGLVTAISTLVGVLLSGLMYKKLFTTLSYRAGIRVAQYNLVMASVFGVFLIFCQNVTQAYICIFMFSAGTAAAMSLSPTILQEVGPRKIRGQVIAIGGLCGMFFSALIPVGIGATSDMLADVDGGIMYAIVLVVIPCILFSAFILRFGEGTLLKTIDEANR
jgi:MFS family permease